MLVLLTFLLVHVYPYRETLWLRKFSNRVQRYCGYQMFTVLAIKVQVASAPSEITNISYGNRRQHLGQMLCKIAGFRTN